MPPTHATRVRIPAGAFLLHHNTASISDHVLQPCPSSLLAEPVVAIIIMMMVSLLGMHSLPNTALPSCALGFQEELLL